MLADSLCSLARGEVAPILSVVDVPPTSGGVAPSFVPCFVPPTSALRSRCFRCSALEEHRLRTTGWHNPVCVRQLRCLKSVPGWSR